MAALYPFRMARWHLEQRVGLIRLEEQAFRYALGKTTLALLLGILDY